MLFILRTKFGSRAGLRKWARARGTKFKTTVKDAQSSKNIWTSHPDLVTRIFKVYQEQLLHTLHTTNILGRVKHCAITGRTEWQGRGNPHVHILVWSEALDDTKLLKEASDVDRFISARMPDKDPDAVGGGRLYKLVKGKMTHRHHMKCKYYFQPCEKGCGHACEGHENEYNRCKRQYPFPVLDETILTENNTVKYRRGPDDGNVVPHNAKLLLKFNCHINVEAVAFSDSIGYMYKYNFKPGQMVDVQEVRAADADGEEEETNHISEYRRCRWVGACEATWRIMQYRLHSCRPSVLRLGIHLPGKKHSRLGPNNEPIQSTKLSTLERYFVRPKVEPFVSQQYLKYYESNVHVPRAPPLPALHPFHARLTMPPRV